MRFYLKPDGSERRPTAAENSHYGIARTELGAAWSGDAEDAYEQMWQRDWMRVVEQPDRVYAEKYLGGQPVEQTALSPAQRQWLEAKELAGKRVIWNDRWFEETRERPPAS